MVSLGFFFLYKLYIGFIVSQINSCQGLPEVQAKIQILAMAVNHIPTKPLETSATKFTAVLRLENPSEKRPHSDWIQPHHKFIHNTKPPYNNATIATPPWKHAQEVSYLYICRQHEATALDERGTMKSVYDIQQTQWPNYVPILPDNNGSRYELKRICETDLWTFFQILFQKACNLE